MTVERTTYKNTRAAVRAVLNGRDVRGGHAIRRYMCAPLPEPGGMALDAGCGVGQGALLLQNRGYAVHAFDRSAAARRLMTLAGIPFAVSTLEAYAPAERFNLITACDVIVHLEDPGAVLARMRAWLAPGGRLYVAVPIEGEASPNPYHLHAWTRSGFLNLMAERWTLDRLFDGAPDNNLWGLWR